jgi:hypothetical protein
MAFIYDGSNYAAFDPVREMKVSFSPRYHDDTATELLRFEDLKLGVKFDFAVRAPEITVRNGTGPDARAVKITPGASMYKEGLAMVMRPAIKARNYFDELGLTSDEFFELVRSAVFQLLTRGGTAQHVAPDFDVRWATKSKPE